MVKPDRKFPATKESDALVRRILRETARGQTLLRFETLVRRIEKAPPPKKPS